MATAASASRCRHRNSARTLRLLCLACALACLLVTPHADARKHSVASSLLAIATTRLVPKLYLLEHCTGKEHALRVTNVSTALDRHGGEAVDADLELLRPAKQIGMVKLSVQRCSGGVSSQVCEHFNAWRFTAALCDMMVAKNMAWTPYMQAIGPALKCPLQAGKHAMRNVTLDLDLVDRTTPGLNLDQYVWLAETQAFDESRRLYSCFRWATEAKRVRAGTAATHHHESLLPLPI